VGLDSSEAALEQARENRAAAGLGPGDVELRRVEGAIWEAVAGEERFDLVVSNPPYVREGDVDGLPAQIRDHEPREALAGGEDGLRVIREIADGAAGHLLPDGALFLEIGDGQGPAVRELLGRDPAWGEVAVAPDLAGRERFVRARPAPGGASEVDVQEG